MTTSEKKRADARERKRRQRERQKAWKKARGAETLNLEIYRGTRKCIDELMADGGFTEQSELITLLIHGAHKLLERDKSQLEELLKV